MNEWVARVKLIFRIEELRVVGIELAGFTLFDYFKTVFYKIQHVKAGPSAHHYYRLKRDKSSSRALDIVSVIEK